MDDDQVVVVLDDVVHLPGQVAEGGTQPASGGVQGVRPRAAGVRWLGLGFSVDRVGGVEGVEVGEEARTEPDPRRVIELWTRYGRGIVTRVGPIMRVVRDAAVVDPEMAEQWATNMTQTAAAFRVLAEQLDDRGALRVPVDEATDILCALSGLEMYLVLADRGWPAEQWERGVVDALTHALLDER